MENTLTLTKYWLEKIVVGLNLCPFAAIPLEKGQIRLVECLESDEDEQINFYLEELELLNDSAAIDINTTLIVYPFASDEFEKFNDLVGELEGMLEDAQLSDVFQLVAFHPKFVFENLDFSHLGNLVNRSPYPTLHILRSEEVSRVLKKSNEGELISFANDKKLHEYSREFIEQLFYYLKF